MCIRDSFNGDNYTKPMKDFLNKYMGKNRNLTLTRQSEKDFRGLFMNSIKVVYNSLGATAFKPIGKFVAAVFDSVMIGASRRLEKGEINDLNEFRKKYQALLKEEEYTNATSTHTTDEKNVKSRITLATNAFADIK